MKKFCIREVEFCSHCRIVKDGAWGEFIFPDAEALSKRSSLERKPPPVAEFVCDRVVHGKNGLEFPVRIRRVVDPDDRIHLLAFKARVAKGAYVVVPLRMKFMGSPY